jgi:hypothetical protein
MRELEDRFAPGEVLEVMLAQRLQRRLRRQLIPAQVVGCFADQRLFAMASRQEARHAVERLAEIIRFAKLRGARMQGHPDF